MATTRVTLSTPATSSSVAGYPAPMWTACTPRRPRACGRRSTIPSSSGIEAGQLFLSEGSLPTAVLAGNDRCAMGLMHALGRGGVDVPGDVSIVGYDDSHLSHLSHIDLTTVRQAADRLAQHAVRSAIERLDDNTIPPKEIVLDPKLVVRGTTAPPKH